MLGYVEILLILLGLAIAWFIQILHTLLAQRVPDALVVRKAPLARPPEALAELFEERHTQLAALGFNDSVWGLVTTQPPIPGLAPTLIRLYRHRTLPVVARVTPPHTLLATDSCMVVFVSLTREKQVMASANRTPELFPRPPASLAINQNTDVDRLEDQFKAHLTLMEAHQAQWLRWPADERWSDWLISLTNHYEKTALQWLHQQRHVQPLSAGGSTPSPANLLRFLWQSLSGRQPQLKPETNPLPLKRAALLFRNWQYSASLPPQPRVQLTLLVISAVLFGLLAGLYWDWRFSLLLLLVILLHGLGHWLTLRRLGYRNLHLLMLPLLGGLTSGYESQPSAANRALVSLMGPLPGILLGWGLWWTLGTDSDWVAELILLLLVINYFHLLPIMPLDGGQLLQALIPWQRLHLLAGLELLGVPALLWLSWELETGIPAVIALIPLLGGLALLKKRTMIQHLVDLQQGSNPKAEMAQIEAAISAVDDFDKSYRPLAHKVRDIEGLLTLLRIQPASTASRNLLLALYLGCFLLPLAAYLLLPSFDITALWPL